MRTIETCRHCGYRIPSDAAICPGCGRRHPVLVRPGARSAPAPAVPTAPPVPAAQPVRRRRHGALVRAARAARGLAALTAWAGAAFAIAAVAAFVVHLDDVADDLSDDLPGQVADVAHGVGLGAAACFLLAVASAAVWSRRAHRNLAALELRAGWDSAWSLGGWLVPGPEAKADKLAVDELWRESSPQMADLPHRGWSRRPVSRVVLHWWTLWLAVPAAGLLAAALVAGGDDLHDERALVGLAGAALAVAAVRALYDIVGLVTVAQAHRAEAVLRDRAQSLPWSDDDEGWADAPLGDDAPADDDALEPLRG